MKSAVGALSLILVFLACRGTPDPGLYDTLWTREAGNPVLRAGRHDSGSTEDYYNLSDCCVVRDGGVFRMWYTASGSTAARAENHAHISAAVSSNGIAWTKDAGNPFLDVGPAEAWDGYGVETVSILIDPNAPTAERYKLWYAGQAAPASYDIGFATSPDGIVWTKYTGNPVLRRGLDAEWDNAFLEGPSVILENGIYMMWYAGFDAVANGQMTDGRVCIGYATSPDGIVWTRHPGNPVMTTGANGTWNSRTVQDPHVIRLADGYHMWYGGKSTDVENYGQQTGYAYSTDGIVWIESARNPILSRGASGAWDATTASYPSVLVDGSLLRMWYTGMDRDYYYHSLFDQSLPEYWEIGYAERLMTGESPAE